MTVFHQRVCSSVSCLCWLVIHTTRSIRGHLARWCRRVDYGSPLPIPLRCTDSWLLCGVEQLGHSTPMHLRCLRAYVVVCAYTCAVRAYVLVSLCSGLIPSSSSTRLYVSRAHACRYNGSVARPSWYAYDLDDLEMGEGKIAQRAVQYIQNMTEGTIPDAAGRPFFLVRACVRACVRMVWLCVL